MQFTKSKFMHWFLDIIIILAGSIFYGVGLNVFIAPNSITMGGATGVATVINHLTSMPIGTWILIVNIPLFIISYKTVGKRFIFKTFIGTVIMSAVVDITAIVFPRTYTEDQLLATVYGGFLTGIGLALIFSRGIMTGGSDLVAKLLQKKYPHIPIGRLILTVDVIIISSASFIYRSFSSALYSIFLIFIFSTVLDNFLKSIEYSKVAFIFTSKNDEILKVILNDISRGATILEARGGYTKEKREVIFCALRGSEAVRLKKIVYSIDEKAFIIFTETSEVSGLGFKAPPSDEDIF